MPPLHQLPDKVATLEAQVAALGTGGGGTPPDLSSYATISYVDSKVALGGAVTSDSNGVSLDSFSGANDDAKLDAALAYASAQTYPPTITFPRRGFVFTTANRTPFEGMRIQGMPGYGNPERASGGKSPSKIQLAMTGPWWNNSVETFGISLHQLTFYQSSGAWILGGTGNYYCLSMRDIFTSNLRGCIGTAGGANKVLMTAASLTGDWEVNNCYNTAFNIGGSDNVLWSDGMLLDSATAFYTAGTATNQFHIVMDFMERSYIGPLYITCEGQWRAIRTEGTAAYGQNTWNGLRVEGRNATDDCDDALMQINGGTQRFIGCNFAYAMGAPTRNNGVIEHAGGFLSLTDCAYQRSNTAAETVPFIYSNTTGKLRVNGIAPIGTWTGLPRVTRPAANAENRTADSTVTLTTV